LREKKRETGEGYDPTLLRRHIPARDHSTGREFFDKFILLKSYCRWKKKKGRQEEKGKNKKLEKGKF